MISEELFDTEYWSNAAEINFHFKINEKETF